MLPNSRISNVWDQPGVANSYTTGVSLHSHTSISSETLDFIHKMFEDLPFAGHVLQFYQRRVLARYGIQLDFTTANWRPPLQPRMAFDLEAKQIAGLGLQPLVSLTDHDSIQAPLLLRTIPQARHIPVSLEWTTPFGATAFHLGIHNIPSAEALPWMARFERFTAAPDDQTMTDLLGELHAIPQVLIVLNHPLWDLYTVGEDVHAAELERFLATQGSRIHALELNGLRHARENRAVVLVAQQWSHLLISGGDRHGLEPNANVNLTNARSFTEFVHEIRVERRSHLLFLEQYRQPWEQRLLQSTLDAITDHPEFSPGWQRWDERAYHQDASNTLRPLAELWPGGRPPLVMLGLLGIVKIFRSRTLARTLSFTCPGVNEVQEDLA